MDARWVPRRRRFLRPLGIPHHHAPAHRVARAWGARPEGVLGSTLSAAPPRAARRRDRGERLRRGTRRTRRAQQPPRGHPRLARLRRELEGDRRRQQLRRPLLGALATPAHLVTRHRRAVVPPVAGRAARSAVGGQAVLGRAAHGRGRDGGRVDRAHGRALRPGQPRPGLLRHGHALSVAARGRGARPARRSGTRGLLGGGGLSGGTGLAVGDHTIGGGMAVPRRLPGLRPPRRARDRVDDAAWAGPRCALDAAPSRDRPDLLWALPVALAGVRRALVATHGPRRMATARRAPRCHRLAGDRQLRRDRAAGAFRHLPGATTGDERSRSRRCRRGARARGHAAAVSRASCSPCPPNAHLFLFVRTRPGNREAPRKPAKPTRPGSRSSAIPSRSSWARDSCASVPRSASRSGIRA